MEYRPDESTYEEYSANGAVVRVYKFGRKLIAKSCRTCGRILILEAFAKDNKNPDKLNYRCRECMKKYRAKSNYMDKYAEGSIYRRYRRNYMKERYKNRCKINCI